MLPITLLCCNSMVLGAKLGIRRDMLRHQKYEFFGKSEPTVLRCSQSAQQFFERYLAAAFLSHGMGVIQAWVSQIIDPGSEIPHQPTGEVQSNLSTGFGHMQRPMPPAGFPPSQHSPPSYSYYSSGAPPSQPVAPPNVQVLAQLNMTAQKHHLSVTYPARMEGLSHSPTWHVQCCCKLGPFM